jgi:hypothetical protein
VAAWAASAAEALARTEARVHAAAAPSASPTSSTANAVTRSTRAACRGGPTEPPEARRDVPSAEPTNRRTVEHVVDCQRGASWSSSHRFTGSPQRNPPSEPSLRSTRWHGTNSAAALRAHADAAARIAVGRPAFVAYSV